MACYIHLNWHSFLLHCCTTDVIRWADPVHQFQALSSCGVSFHAARFAKTNLETKAGTVHLGSATGITVTKMAYWRLACSENTQTWSIQYSEVGHHKWWLKQISSGWMTQHEIALFGLHGWIIQLLLHRSLHHLPRQLTREVRFAFMMYDEEQDGCLGFEMDHFLSL